MKINPCKTYEGGFSEYCGQCEALVSSHTEKTKIKSHDGLR